MLDRIDYNVERTAEHTKEAEKELKVATGYQKRSVKRKVILLLVLVVVGMFILLLVKPKSRGGGGGGGGSGGSAGVVGDGVPALPDTPDNGLPPLEANSPGAGDPFHVGTGDKGRRWVEWKRRRRRVSSNGLSVMEI